MPRWALGKKRRGGHPQSMPFCPQPLEELKQVTLGGFESLFQTRPRGLWVPRVTVVVS